MPQLPNEIIPIPCADKCFQERWSKNRNLLNFPKSWRGIFIGPPSSGKSTVIKNIILRAKPQFEEVLVVHFDPEGTEEWDDIEASMIDELPDPKDFGRDVNTLLILEDLNLANLPKDDQQKLNRLFGYTSSHCNVSIALTAQNAYDVPTCARRTANLFIIYRQPDISALATMASRTGFKKTDFLAIIDKYLKTNHDSLWIDLTKNSPAPLRINGFKVIKKKE